MQPQILPGPWAFWLFSIAEVQGNDQLSLLKGESYCLWCFHRECSCFNVQVQGTQIQDRPTLVVWFWNQKQQRVIEGQKISKHDFLTACFNIRE